MAWTLLFIAGVLEIVWAVALKQSNGFSDWRWTAVVWVAAPVSFALLGQAMKDLPVGTAYAVWTGIGAVGAALIGVMFLKEPVTAMRIGSIVLIILGIAGLRLTSGGTA